jgi:hypothetical protein
MPEAQSTQNAKRRSSAPRVGDRVTYYYWIGGDAGQMYQAPGTVTAVFEPDDGPSAIALLVEFPEEVIATEGFCRQQSHARMRTHFDGGPDDPETVHDSGTWAPSGNQEI